MHRSFDHQKGKATCVFFKKALFDCWLCDAAQRAAETLGETHRIFSLITEVHVNIFPPFPLLIYLQHTLTPHPSAPCSSPAALALCRTSSPLCPQARQTTPHWKGKAEMIASFPFSPAVRFLLTQTAQSLPHLLQWEGRQAHKAPGSWIHCENPSLTTLCWLLMTVQLPPPPKDRGEEYIWKADCVKPQTEQCFLLSPFPPAARHRWLWASGASEKEVTSAITTCEKRPTYRKH